MQVYSHQPVHASPAASAFHCSLAHQSCLKQCLAAHRFFVLLGLCSNSSSAFRSTIGGIPACRATSIPKDLLAAPSTNLCVKIQSSRTAICIARTSVCFVCRLGQEFVKGVWQKNNSTQPRPSFPISPVPTLNIISGRCSSPHFIDNH